MSRYVTCLTSPGCPRCGAPLPPRRSVWCSNECREDYYRNHIWTFARAEAMKRADWRCVGCGGHATEVDHIEPRNGQPIHAHSCAHHQGNLRALCHDCHVNRERVFAPSVPALPGERADEEGRPNG